MTPAPSPLVVAVPKGRLARQLAPRLARAGVAPETFAESDRRLQRDAVMGGVAVRFLMLKPDDVPTYVEHGAAHAGVVGRDVLLERGSDVYAPLDLDLGRCRMVVAAPDGAGAPPPGHVLRVATKYPRIAAAHYAARGEDVEVIYVQGSVETAPLVGLADVIVDLVETGETLRQNGLSVREAVCEVSAVLVVNRVGMKLRRAEVAALTACLGAP
ncbi:MAG: ATP phosphoribosyltransferase [Polyangiales bacterium]